MNEFNCELYDVPYYDFDTNSIYQDYIVKWIDELGLEQYKIMTVKLDAKDK